MDPVRVMIAGVILAVVGIFVILGNFFRIARSMDNNGDISVTCMIGGHILGYAIFVIGVVSVAIGVIIVIFGD